jgi:hypothetical protein
MEVPAAEIAKLLAISGSALHGRRSSDG